jgi:dolichyl-phosphate-mannose-protein mannosyltransferase
VNWVAQRERLLIPGAIAAAAALWAVAVAADSVGLGASPGYDWRQITGAEVGALLLVLVAVYASRRAISLSGLRVSVRRPSLPVIAVAVGVIAFVAVSVWWVLTDGWVPNGDAGRHLLITSNYYNAIENGDLSYPLNTPPVIDNEFYPPFIHLVGVLGSFVGGFSIVTGVVTLNVVFVPLLALGCYGIGSYVFDRWAGALAAVWVLGTPILISQFHVYMLDAPVTALVAMSVWLLLLSERFSRTGIAALAGVAVGCGIMAKATFPLFVLGLIAVMLIRGGWRNWRGALAFLGVAMLISQPWLMLHEDMLRDRADRALDMPENPNPLADGAFGNFGAYFWVTLTTQLLAPLFIFFAIGLGHSVWSAIRRRAPDGVLELLGGLAVGVVAVASMDWFNIRYDTPLLPYAAVLAVGWVTMLRNVPVRIAIGGALVAVSILNSVMINSGFGSRVTVGMPFSDRYATVISDTGYVENQPRPDIHVDDLLKDAHAEGATRVIFQPETLNNGGFNLNGLATMARMADLGTPAAWLTNELGPNDIYMTREPLSPTKDACVAVNDGTWGLFLYRGPIAPGSAPAADEAWCPPGWEGVRAPPPA